MEAAGFVNVFARFVEAQDAEIPEEGEVDEGIAPTPDGEKGEGSASDAGETSAPDGEGGEAADGATETEDDSDGFSPDAVDFAFMNAGENYCGANVTWSLDDAGVLTISGTGAMDDYDINNDQAPWFVSRKSVNSVVVGSGVRHIGDAAFYYCENLTSASIPEGVTSIGQQAFGFCANLASLTIGDSATYSFTASTNRSLTAQFGEPHEHDNDRG